jgi:hypothetical protein
MVKNTLLCSYTPITALTDTTNGRFRVPNGRWDMGRGHPQVHRCNFACKPSLWSYPVLAFCVNRSFLLSLCLSIIDGSYPRLALYVNTNFFTEKFSHPWYKFLGTNASHVYHYVNQKSWYWTKCEMFLHLKQYSFSLAVNAPRPVMNLNSHLKTVDNSGIIASGYENHRMDKHHG